MGTIAFHIRYGGTSVIDSYKVPTFHVSYGETIRVIDSYHVPAFKSYHTCEETLLQGTCIPYKVLGTIAFHIRYGGTSVIDSYKVPTFRVSYGETIRVIDSYQVPAFKSYHTCEETLLQGTCIPYKVLGTIAFHIRYGGTSFIDSYKVPTFHIRYGGP